MRKPQQKSLLNKSDGSQTILRIANWEKTYETSESRRKYKTLDWFRHPVKTNTAGFHALLDNYEVKDGLAIYGCWQLLCKVAATSSVRGVFCDSDGKPYTLRRIAREAKAGEAVDLITETIRWAISVGWLEECDLAQIGLAEGRTIAGSDPEVIRTISGSDPEVIRTISGSDPEVIRTISGSDPESCQATLRDVTRRDETKPHPTSDSGVGDSSELPSDWPSVERELANCGVSLAKQACVEAKSHGSTPEAVAKLIAHYRDHPGAWGPAALFLRVKSPAVSLSASDGWPKPSEEYAARQRKEQAARDAQRQRDESAAKLAEQDEHAKKVESEQFALTALEKELGHELDELPISELLELVPVGPAQKTLKAKGWRAPLVRGTILRAYQKAGGR